MIGKVLKYVKDKHMLEEGDCVVAGVSGGADSVCLLFVLLEIRKVIPIDIRVVHINHMIRADAQNDAKYVEELCINNGISFTLVEKDVEKMAQELHISTEEAGRNVRYEAFYKELGDKKGKIAVAHNKNDCCETFLFNLFRGSSLKGLVGIRPVRDNIIRPLMCLERSEIEAFLNERNIRYCIDSTNLEDNYTRNKIRHHILERVQKDISPGAVGNISNACERVSEAYDLIEDMACEGYKSCVSVHQKAYHIDGESFGRIHKTVQGYVIMKVLSDAAGSSKDLEAVHVNQVRELFDRQCGRVIRLPYKLRAKRDYTGICIYKEDDNKPLDKAFEDNQTEILLSVEDKVRLLEGKTLEISLDNGGFLEFKLVKDKNIPQKKYTKWLDYDKIKNSIAIRKRRAGDYLTVNTSNQRKTLKSYFIDEKVPAEQRSDIWLVADGSHIMWIMGRRISSYYKISENTENVLRITYMCERDKNNKED
jgi:tRNA(Ile)-lysidine synthase